MSTVMGGDKSGDSGDMGDGSADVDFGLRLLHTDAPFDLGVSPRATEPTPPHLNIDPLVSLASSGVHKQKFGIFFQHHKRQAFDLLNAIQKINCE